MVILGHSQIAVTMNIYGHVLPAMQQEAAGQIDAALSDYESDEAGEWYAPRMVALAESCT